MSEPVVVVGAGISGLTVAHRLVRRLGPAADVTVLEAGDRVGGKIVTVDVAGLPVDTGPDAFLSRAPALRALLDEVGLDADVHAPLSAGAWVWSRGRLRPLPVGAAFGLPERILPLLSSGLLSPVGAARAGLDLVLPPTPATADPSVGDLVRPRFGRQVHERLVAPLLGGVHAGDADLLSARSAAPEVAAMARSGRSLYLTMRARRRAAPPPPPGGRPAPLVSVRGGLGRLTQALTDAVGPQHVLTGIPATGLRRRAGGGLLVDTPAGEVPAARVVLAVPAPAAAGLLAPLSGVAAAMLRGIAYVDVANVTLAFPRHAVPRLPAGTGFLVPPVEGELLVGCSLLSGKWPHLAGHDVVLVRAMVGRFGDRRWLGMTDDGIEAAVRDALGRMLGIRADPVDRFVQRWPEGIPQYLVGHADRVARADAAVGAVGGIHLAGAAYRGVGMASCVASATSLADRIAAEVDR